MGGTGAKGSFNSCGGAVKLRQILITSSRDGFLPANPMLQQAMWPSETGTRLQCADIFILPSGTILPPLTLPSIFKGSTSDLSSSPASDGRTLSIRSIQAG